ncbi:MAG: tRNA pseudouridine(38-40) synthase TruA [Candidatus Limivicinus sp.]
MRNFRICLCYDGGRYRGWQKQGNTGGTIQEKIEALLSRLLAQPVEVAASGRTDAGVHARCQTCSFRADTSLSCPELLELIRRYLPEDIGVLSIEEAEPRFHARLSCLEKTYVYHIWNSPAPNVFYRHYSHSWPKHLDLEAMRQAAALLTGEHDFTSFCSAKKMKKSAVRDLRSIELSRDGDMLRISLSGSGFLYNMVRIIVGTLLEVGSGERSAEDMRRILEARDRQAAGFTAPPQGLFLWEEKY